MPHIGLAIRHRPRSVPTTDLDIAHISSLCHPILEEARSLSYDSVGGCLTRLAVAHRSLTAMWTSLLAIRTMPTSDMRQLNLVPDWSTWPDGRCCTLSAELQAGVRPMEALLTAKRYFVVDDEWEVCRTNVRTRICKEKEGKRNAVMRTRNDTYFRGLISSRLLTTFSTESYGAWLLMFSPKRM